MRTADYIDAYYMALLYESLGMRDQAFVELERAVEENSITLCLLDVDAKIDSLRHDPRFLDLRRRVFQRDPAANPSDSLQRSSAQA